MISSNENRIIYNGNGAATEFGYQFKILEKTDVNVVLVDPDLNETTLTKDYFVDMEKSVVLYPGYSPGAELPEAEQPPILPEGWQLVLYRDVPITQESHLDEHFPFNVIEAALDKLTIICQQLWDNVTRSLRLPVATPKDTSTVLPIPRAGESFRWSDDAKQLVTTEDPAKVLPLAEGILKKTEQVKEEAIIAKDTAIEAATTAAEDAAQKTVENITTEIDSKVAAAEDSKNAAAQSASSAADSMAAAQTSKEAAAASANSASSSATTATKQADRAQDIADNLEGLAGITGIATTEEAIAGVVDNKAMTPFKVKKAIEAQVPIKEIVNSIYPVGQIVEYASNVNPNELYPWQTWEQIKDVFTLASGNKYSIGQTGGVSTVTLTVAQIPEHIHTASVQNASLTGRINGSANSSNGYNNNPLSGSGVFSGSGAINGYGEGGEWNKGTATWAGLNFGGTHNHDISIKTTGGGEAHNNMPPYLVTIKWKRTA